MTVRWCYFEEDAYKRPWVNFAMSLVDPAHTGWSGGIKHEYTRDAIKSYRGTLAGWEVVFETEQDLQFFLLKWS